MSCVSSISIEAGLPNITGRTTGYAVQNGSGSGALTSTVTHGANLWGSVFTYIASLSLDASKSNAIYGTSDTVTPLSLTTKIVLKY